MNELSLFSGAGGVMIYFQTDRGVLHQGHVIDILQEMPPESVHCVITSPPYWGLRDYSIEGQVWDEIPENCYKCPQHNNGPCTICHCLGKEHVWGNELKKRNRGSMGDKSTLEGGDMVANIESNQGQFCQHCNAWKGSLGLEPTPELYIDHIVQVFRSVWRVLHPSGTIWVNLGSSYWGGKGKSGQAWATEHQDRDTLQKSQHQITGMGETRPSDGTHPSYKPKDLIMIPHLVAEALRQDGWYLRSAMPWVKRSAMPESCTDRPASALEYMFLLSKNQHYFFDMDAVRQENSPTAHTWKTKEPGKKNATRKDEYQVKPQVFREYIPTGRNYRNTDLFFESIAPPHGMIFCGDEPVGLDVNPQAMKAQHFASFPEKLVKPCLKAGTSEKGCCPECLAPWERIVEKVGAVKNTDYANESRSAMQQGGKASTTLNAIPAQSKTIGWKPTCKCNQGYHDSEGNINDNVKIPPIPCTVMDIFGGSGTVAVVAEKHRRNWILVELSSDYCELSKDRIQQATKQKRLF